MKKSKLNILITGSGAPGWVPLFKCLVNNEEKKEFDIYGCDVKDCTAGSYYAKKHFILPYGNDPTYIDKLLKTAIREKIDMIIPITDAELLPIARHRRLFENHAIHIPISDPDALSISLNKLNLYRFLSTTNSSYLPEYYLVSSWNSFTKSLKKLGYPENPVCFKPVVAWGSRGFRIIDPKINMYEMLMKEKPSDRYMTMNQTKEILVKAKPFPELLLMEHLSGKEYTVDILAKNNRILYVIPRLRLQARNGITTEGIVENNREIITISKKIITALKLDYSVGIQFKYSKSNKPKVLEVNPRLQGTTVISYGAGVNLPFYTVKAALNEKIPVKKILFGIHMFRHWQEVFFKDHKKLYAT